MFKTDVISRHHARTLFFRKFFLNYLVFFLVAFAGAFTVFMNMWNHQLNIIKTGERLLVEREQAILSTVFAEATHGILFLSNHQALREVLKKRPEIADELLKSAFHSFAEANSEIIQVRLLDKAGQEMVRVNSDSAQVTIVPENDLQNKANRHYFEEGRKIDKKQIYLTRLDLNMEYGEIEVPYNPTFRMMMPIRPRYPDSSYVIINYSGKYLFSYLRNQWDHDLSSLWILDEKGNWVNGPNVEWNWSGVLPERAGFAFREAYPDVYRKLYEENSHQIHTKDGLFTIGRFTIEDPAIILESFDNGRSANTWLVLISVVYDKNLKHRKAKVFRTIFIPFFVLALIAIVVIGFISDNQVVKKLQYIRIERLNTALKAVFDLSPLPIIIQNSDLKIQQWNHAAEAMFGWRYDEVVNRPNPTLTEEQREELRDCYTHLPKNPKSVHEHESSRLSKKKTPINAQIWATSYQSRPDTGDRDVMEIIADITIKKEAEKLHKEAEHLQVSRKMARTIAHEFRQPMSVISLAVDMLRSTDVNESQLEAFLDRIPAMLKRMDILVQNMLNLTELQSVPYAQDVEILDIVNNSDEEKTDMPEDSQD